jgi:uncharacterized membrane protein
MSLALGLLLSMVALVASVIALLARARTAPEGADGRVAALESQVRLLLDRVRALEEAADQGRAPAAVLPTPAEAPAPEVVTAPVGPDASFGAAPLGASAGPSVPTSSPPLRPSRPSLGLEQRIGARWATWVGIVVILVAAALFLKWAFDNEYLGPAARVGVGVVGGLLMLVAGLLLHRRQDVPYLSEGLAGGGLGCLYLSLFAAHALYGLIGPAAAFTSMFAVTLLGTLVAVLSGRLSTAVLAVLGGLLTPVLLRVERPDERNLLAYLLVLDVLVLLVARFRTWPALTQLAWGGSALLLLPTLWGAPEAPHPLTRLLLLSALFLVFLAAPLFRERATGHRSEPIDLILVVANAAGYFWAVYFTLEATRPGLEAPWAVGLAVLYRVVSSDYGSRVSADPVPVLVHEGVSWTFLTLAIPLALDVQWITLAWAVEGVMLLWLASRVPISVAAWGGLVALLLAFSRAVAFDRYWSADIVPVWNLTFLVHLLVAGALAVGGWLGGRITAEERFRPNPPLLQGALWVASVVTLAVLFWREPTGLWPATLLTFEIVAVAWLGRGSTSPAFAVAIPFLAVVLILRVLLADDDLARAAAGSLLNRPLLSRVGACLGMGLAGGFLVRAPGASARLVGRIVSGGAGLVLLFALSLAWTRYQGALESAARASGRRVVGDVGWRIQVGLSVLWTVYAALALAWGFARRNPAVRYAALALLGLTVFKVFAVDFSAAKTSLRILSFLVLGVVLLLVSLVYQKLLGRRI